MLSLFPHYQKMMFLIKPNMFTIWSRNIKRPSLLRFKTHKGFLIILKNIQQPRNINHIFMHHLCSGKIFFLIVYQHFLVAISSLSLITFLFHWTIISRQWDRGGLQCYTWNMTILPEHKSHEIQCLFLIFRMYCRVYSVPFMWKDYSILN